MKNGELNAEDIIRFIEKQSLNSAYDLVVSEFCPYQENRRIDLFYFKRWDRQTKGYEIKVNRSDFLNDKKWQEYLKFCTWFSFIAPLGIIKKEELPNKIGLVEVEVIEIPKEELSWREKDKDIEEDEKHYRLKMHITKKARKINEEIKESEYIRLLEGLLFKLIYNKNIRSI